MKFLAQQNFYLPALANLDTTVSTVMKEKVCTSHPSIWLNTLKYDIFVLFNFQSFMYKIICNLTITILENFSTEIYKYT